MLLRPDLAAATQVVPGSQEWVEHRIPDERKHANETLSQSKGIGRWVVPCGGSADIGPDLLEPELVAFVGNHRQETCGLGRLPVPTGLSLEEDVLDIVLDHGVGLVRLAERGAVPSRLVRGVGDLSPDDWCEVVQSHAAAVFLDRGMERHHQVPPETAPREIHVPYNDYETTAGNENPVGFLPHQRKLPVELFVVLDRSKLLLMAGVLFQCPVGRRGHNQVDGLVTYACEPAAIALGHDVLRGDCRQD